MRIILENTKQFTEVCDYHNSWYVFDARALEPLQWIPGLYLGVHPSVHSFIVLHNLHVHMLKIRHMDEATKTLNSICIIRTHTIDM